MRMNWSWNILICLTLALVSSSASFALEEGDVFFVSNGVGLTVIDISKRDQGSVHFTARKLTSNAAEYCARYEQIEIGTDKMNDCIKRNVGNQEAYKVFCRNRTIINESGSYRPSKSPGIWTAVGNENWILRGDELFKQACKG